MSLDTAPSVYQRHSFNPRPDGRPRFPSSFLSTKVEPFVPTQSKRIPIIDPETEIDITLSSPPIIKSTQRREVVEVNVPASRWRSRDLGQSKETTSKAAEVLDISEEVVDDRGRPEVGSWRSRPTLAKSRPVSLQSIHRRVGNADTGSVSPTTKTRASSTSNDLTPRATPANESKYSTTRRASVPIALASFPHASVPSIPYTQMPDLNRIRPIAPYRVAEQLLLTEPCQLPRTKEFALAPPPYSDTDIPPPEPYNEAYPHPLTSYASPGVNPNSVLLSGYDIDLAKLMETDRAKALGTILATCDRPGITAPTLAKHLRSYIPDGNGIPGFDNEGAARAALGPIGAAMCRGDERLSELTGGGGSGIQPVFTPAISHVPPRHAAQSQARMEARMREPKILSIAMPMSTRESSYEYNPMTPPLTPGYERRSSVASQESNYFTIPPHPAVIRRASTVSAFSDAERQYSTLNTVEVQHLDSPVPKTYNTSLATSPWYKTELCPAHQESGQCRYGIGCQFAHGLQELRLGLGRMPYPEMQHEQINPITDPTPSAPVPKIDIRRASAPHSQLPTVAEVDDDHYYHNFTTHNSGRRSSEATEVPHSGYERFIRSDSIARLSIPRDSSSHLASSMSSDMPWTPTQLLSSQSTSTRNAYSQNLQNRASDSSLSFTSSAAYSPKADADDDSTPTGQHTPYPLSVRRPPSSPSSNDREAGSGSGSSWGSRSPGQAVTGNTTSATVDFSAGRSIWC